MMASTGVTFHLRPAELDDVASIILCFLESTVEPSADQHSTVDQPLLLDYWRRWVQLSIEEPLQHVVVVAVSAAAQSGELAEVVGFQSFLPFLPHFHFRRLTGMSSTYVRRSFHRTRAGSQLMAFGLECVRLHTQLVRLYGHTDAANRSINALVRRQRWTIIGQCTLKGGTDTELIWEYTVTRTKL